MVELEATPVADDELPDIGSALLKLHTHQALEYRCIQRGSPYRLVISIGGIRSGKSLCIALWLLDRGEWDTDQMHALAGNTRGQVDNLIQEVMRWVTAAGVEWVINVRPPEEWVESWRAHGIKVPPRRPSYRGILILSSGLHVQIVTLANRAFEKIKGAQWGSAIIEEVCAGATEEAVRYIFERVNCALGPRECARRHHHVKVLHSNPPDQDAHWIYDWLMRYEQRAAEVAGIERIGEDLEAYKCLLNGIGDVIYIPSRTLDNLEHLPADYVDDMLGAVDSTTAEKVLDGAMRRTQKGRVYRAYSYENQIDTFDYDSNRDLYVALDFNKNPAVAILGHPLIPGEYPTQPERPDKRTDHVGIFGEIFHIGGADTGQLCEMLLYGEPGSDGSLPGSFEGLAKHKTKVHFFGDATSNYETMAPKDWPIIDAIMRRELGSRYVKRSETKRNPGVTKGVHAVNMRFHAPSGVRALWIHPRCRRMIEDLLSNSWHRSDPDKIYKPGPRGGAAAALTTHLGDALRYLIAELFPMGNDAPQKSPSDAMPKIGGSGIKIPATRLGHGR